MLTPDVCYEQVYYVDSRAPLNPVAIRPHLKQDFIEWGDTSWGTFIKVQEVKTRPQGSSLPDVIEIIPPNGEKVTLYRLTLDLYNEKVKERVAGHPDFTNDQELQQYYLITNFDAY